MWYILQRLLVITLMGTVLQTSVGPAAVQSNAWPEPFLAIEFAAPAVQPGQTQIVYLQLDSVPGDMNTVTLALTYPSGLQRSVIESTLTGETTLEWEIPPEAGAGVVAYELSVGNCGCGYARDGTPKPAAYTNVQGSFLIASSLTNP